MVKHSGYSDSHVTNYNDRGWNDLTPLVSYYTFWCLNAGTESIRIRTRRQQREK